MSTKIKKKSEKTKKVKTKKERAPLKESYSEEEKVELKNKYTDILVHLSNFLSEHNVYEAVPENAKILVFSSELSFYEMIKVFIFEDIYCGLIYDSKLNNYLGLITTRDLIILYNYIIDNFPSEEITDFNSYLKKIFSKKIENKKLNNSDNNINNNINIFEYLQNVNYIDYLIYVKRIDFQNIKILSVSLDDNLLETLEKINIKNIHRLLVEEDKKQSQKNLPKIKSSKKIEEKEKEIKRQQINEQKSQKRNSKTEKTTTTNYSDEENKNNTMFGKKEIKQIEEMNKDKIIEEKAQEEATGSSKVIIVPEQKKEEIKHVKKKVVKKKKKFEEHNKPKNINIQTNDNIQTNTLTNDNNINIDDDNNKSKDEIKPKKKKIVKKKKKEEQHPSNANNINTYETEPNKEEKAKEIEKEKEKEEKEEESKQKKKKIIKKKKKHNEENTETNETIRTIPESKTDDELGAKIKKIVKKKVKTIRKTTTDVPNLIKKEEKEEKNTEEKITEEKKIVKKKIVKKKVIKKKKKGDISVDNINISSEQSKKERPETAHEKFDTKIENCLENGDNDNTVRPVTEAGGEPSSEKKDKYELPKLKMKRKSSKQRTKKYGEKRTEIEQNKNNNEEKFVKKDKEYEKKEFENKEIKIKESENKENENKEKEKSIESNDNINNSEKEGKEKQTEKKEEEIKESIEKQEIAKEEINNITNKVEDNKQESNESNKDNIEKNEEENGDKIEERIEEKDIKNEIDIIAEILHKTHLEEMRNYIGIVTNETIFEYLFLNYYSNEMNEFNLSLNELLVLGDIPLLKKLKNSKDMNEKVYQTFNTYLFNNNADIIPIFNNKEIEGFIYPKDFLYYIYNCESNQTLTNEEFLISIYKEIDEEKPYGKNRVTYLELNDRNKTLYVKELIEKLNCSIEKKIIIYDPTNNSNLYLISLRTIFKAIAEFQSNKK